MKYFLGVDGGATKTEAIVVDEEVERIGIGFAGPSNYQTIGLQRASKNIAKAILEACNMLKIKCPLDSACIALAGLNSKLDYEILIQELSKLDLYVKFRLIHDGQAALHANTKGKKGIVVILGTGSLVAGYDDEGKYVRACNWGHLLGDEGSAYRIAIKTLARILRGYDCRASRLNIEEKILKVLGIEDPSEITTLVNTKLNNEDIAKLAPFIIENANEEVIEILKEEAIAISECVKTIHDKVKSREIFLTGGLTMGKHTKLYINIVKEEILKRVSGAKIKVSNLKPVIGSLMIAFEEENMKLENKKIMKIAKVF